MTFEEEQEYASLKALKDANFIKGKQEDIEAILKSAIGDIAERWVDKMQIKGFLVLSREVEGVRHGYAIGPMAEKRFNSLWWKMVGIKANTILKYAVGVIGIAGAITTYILTRQQIRQQDKKDQLIEDNRKLTNQIDSLKSALEDLKKKEPKEQPTPTGKPQSPPPVQPPNSAETKPGW